MALAGVVDTNTRHRGTKDSEMTGMGPGVGAKSGTQFDVAVVGSGFGGSVTAARLAEAGMRVLVFERGPWWGSGADDSEATQRPHPHGKHIRKLIRGIRIARGKRSREVMLARDGMWEVHAFRRLLTLTGAGVGGGSHLYAGLHVQPDDEFFDHFPDEFTGSEMRPFFDRVREVLRPAPLPNAGGPDRAFETALAAAGYPAPVYPDAAIAWGEDPDHPSSVLNAAGVEQQTSRLIDSTFFGCTDRSKTTLDLTYIPMAVRSGATVRALTEVTGIARTPNGYEVSWTDHNTRSKGTTAVPRLVLSAGTLNTLRLLFTARERGDLPGLSPMLGQRFSSNGDIATVLLNPGASDRVSPPVTPYVRQDTGDGTFRYLVAQVTPRFEPVPMPKRLRRAANRTVILFGMGRDGSRSSVSLTGKGITTPIQRSDADGLYEEIETLMEGTAAGFDPRRRFMNIPAGRGRSTLFSVHPLGGAGIGNSPR